MSISLQAITSGSSTAATQSDTAGATATSKTLGQDDFLKLLVAQLSAQDPLNPQKDTDYLAQLAQFSSLEQTKAMQSSLSQIQSSQQLTQAQSLIGHTVQIDAGSGASLTGTVQSVQLVDGAPKVSVNGLLYNLSQITAVSSTVDSTPTNASNSANVKAQTGAAALSGLGLLQKIKL